MVQQTPIPFQTPVLSGPYSSIGVDYGSSNGETFQGPVESGGGRYFVLFGRDSGLSATTIRVTKSVDSGATWVTQDIANEPAVDFAGGIDVCHSGTNLFITYAPTVSTIRTITFAMATDTYGTPTADLSFTATTSLVNLRTVRVTSGDIFCFMDTDAPAGILYAKLSSGVWGATQVIEAVTGGNDSRIRSVVVDTTDLIHILYQIRVASSSTRQLSYRSLTTAGTLSARTTIVSRVNIDWNIGHASIWGDNLVVPTPVVVAGRLRTGVYIGAGLSSIAFGAFVQLDTNTFVGGGFTDIYLYSLTSQDGLTDYVFWSSQINVGFNSALDAIYYCSNSGGGWSAPILFYDANAYPPPDPVSADNQFIHKITLNLLNSGLFGAAINLESAAFDSACVAFTLLDSETPPPEDNTFIQVDDEDTMVFKKQWIEDPDNQFPWGAIAGVIDISCNNPCDPVLGVPYNHAFTATGTPPYTYSILSGALPTGFTLNSTTGIASGLPSEAGTFSFVVQVIDALLASDTVSCSITVTDHVCPWQLCDLFTTSAACAMDGTVGLRRTADGVTGDSDAVSSNPITVVAGQIYFIEFFLRGSGGADGTISVGYDFYDVNNTYLSSAYVTSTGSPVVFTSFTGTVTVPANAVTAVPVIVANDHLTGIWCIAALFSVLMDNYFILSSIRSYFTDYTMYR